VKRIAFLNDTSAWYHWGCTGTSEAIKAGLAARGFEVTPVPIHLLYECGPVPETAADFDSPAFFNRFFQENLAVTGPILKNDIILVNGEGSLHGLSPLARVLLYLAYASKKICGKNVQIINHSCFPDSSAIVENSPSAAVYRGVYRLLDFVAVRERYSFELLKKMGINATLAFDCLPLYIQDHPVNAPPERSRSIVVAGSVAWLAEGITALAAYIRSMAADGYAIKVLTGAKDRPAQDDLAFLTALRQAASEGWSHVDARSMSEWLHTIRSAALLVSGRFHYTIASCMLDTPCIVLDSNTPKNRVLCEDAHLSEPLAYSTDKLDVALRTRTVALLSGKTNSNDATKREWCNRAERNFDGLPRTMPENANPTQMIRVYSGESKGATAFFRNRALLDTLTSRLAGESPRVLFHAVSIGAEAYSFAIYCQMRGIRCKVIQASDISGEFLERAAAARYESALLESMSNEEKAFFEVFGETFTPRKSIRDSVSFLPACSFVTAEFAEPYDVVFLSNALTYVSPFEQSQTISRIARYNTRYLILTAFHPQTIESDLRSNGYEPLQENLEAIHDGWGDRIFGNAPEGHSWMLRPFSRVEGYEYKYCAIFRKTDS